LRNILYFIRRHFNFLLFLFLQVLSLYFIVTYSKYHQAVFGDFSHRITGNINTRYANVQQYFYLKRTNDSLVRANEILYNKLKDQYSIADSNYKTQIDSLQLDSILQFRKITYLSARVVSNSVTTQSNFIVVARGSKEGIKEGMGAVDPNNGVIGIVTDVDDNYAVIMSMLHKDSHISGKLDKTGETGTLNWDGQQPNRVQLSGVPSGTQVKKGDRIISSGFSTAFPQGLHIGVVTGIKKEKSSSSFNILIKTAADFNSLQYVYLIDHVDALGSKRILEKNQKSN